MLVLLVVLPCLLLGVVAVVVLDRRGVLSGFEHGSAAARSAGDNSFLEQVPKAALVAGMALMAAWIAAWLILLIVGLQVMAA